MYPAPFSYHRASSIDDALAVLAEHGDGAKLLAGGHSLLPAMKLRLAQPEMLIDLNALDDLRTFSVDGDTLTVGALVTHHTLAIDPAIRAASPLLAEIAGVVGDQQIRTLGTIGGALAHADPAADYPAGVLALNATVVATSSRGEREIAIDDFFLGFLTTALEADEIITSIRVPASTGLGTAYEKLANPASGYATVGVAVAVTKAGDGTIGSIRIGITGTGASAYRPTSVEEALTGTGGDDESVKAAAASATEGVDVLEDKHAPSAYRAKVTVNLVRRAVKRALDVA